MVGIEVEEIWPGPGPHMFVGGHVGDGHHAKAINSHPRDGRPVDAFGHDGDALAAKHHPRPLGEAVDAGRSRARGADKPCPQRTLSMR
jgi:hypothetical protein